ncbi:hypothetical protein E4U41_000147 [Claviceps citrina]|nr:hypothetical protein E4U41_000147 [Claviceps citrina]
MKAWQHWVGPLGRRGTKLGSPSVLATEPNEWMDRFRELAIGSDWHFTCLHVYAPDADLLPDLIGHFYYKFGKMIWVTAFGCRHDPARPVKYPKSPCGDQAHVSRTIREMVDFFERDGRVAAYAYPDRNEYCDICAAVDEGEKKLTKSGQAYLDAISRYSSRNRTRER